MNRLLNFLLWPFRSCKLKGPSGLDDHVTIGNKLVEAKTLLEKHLPKEKATNVLEHAISLMELDSRSYMSVIELVEFHSIIEHGLYEVLDVDVAKSIIKKEIEYSEQETHEMEVLKRHLDFELDIHEDESKHCHKHRPDQDVIDELKALIDDKDHMIIKDKNKIDQLYGTVFKYRLENQQLTIELNHLKDELRRLMPSDEA